MHGDQGQIDHNQVFHTLNEAYMVFFGENERRHPRQWLDRGGMIGKPLLERLLKVEKLELGELQRKRPQVWLVGVASSRSWTTGGPFTSC